MSFQEVLEKILEIANYPQGEREKFIHEFYRYYYSEVIDKIGGIDPTYAKKFVYALDHANENPQAVNDLWQEMLGDEKLRQDIQEVTDEVLTELAGDISKSATEEEKQQILALVTA